MVTTRNLPPGSSGKPSGAGSFDSKGVMPEATTPGGEKLLPASVDLTNFMSVPAVQTMYRVPSEATAGSGEPESSTPGISPPFGWLPTPTQVAPLSVVRAKRSFEAPKPGPSSQTA